MLATSVLYRTAMKAHARSNLWVLSGGFVVPTRAKSSAAEDGLIADTAQCPWDIRAVTNDLSASKAEGVRPGDGDWVGEVGCPRTEV